MLLATVVLYGAGYLLVTGARRYGASLVFGGTMVGLTQLFPVIHFVVWCAGLGLGKMLNVVVMIERDPFDYVTNFWGGFVVMLAAGSGLMVFALWAGEVLRRVTAERWWKANDR